ncbi:thioredoxin [Sodaliphilus pleomorphus]
MIIFQELATQEAPVFINKKERNNIMNNFQELIASDKPVLVDFFATWCGPCKMMHPILEDISKQVGDRAKVVKIDVDQAEDLAMQYRIQSVPTLMIFKQGEMLWRESGVHDAATMVQLLEKYM